MVFVDDLDRPVVDEGDRHHLTRVLRVRPGSPIVVCDGRGSWRTARLGDEIDNLGRVVVSPAAAAEVGVCFALVKGDRPELVTQKLTELGVHFIVPFVAERSVVRWEGDKVARQHERLKAVAREASMQCRRTRLPQVASLARFADIVGGRVADLDPGWMALAEQGGPRLDPGTRMILVGPEGGWTADERDAVESRVGLGELVLRAETAAVVAGAALTTFRSDSHTVSNDPY